MQDPANQWLIEQIKTNAEGSRLWFADENFTPDDFIHLPTSSLSHSKNLRIISNRFDLADQLLKQNFNAEFSDFETNSIPEHSLDRIFYRVSKEKSLTHHLINLAARLLKPEGELYLVGYKQEGIKTTIEKASQTFGVMQKAIKQGPFYFARLKLSAINTTLLPTENYTQARKVFDISQGGIHSKPGQFGWNKIDQGSELLIEQFGKYVTQHTARFNQCLDLGCGYGYLSIAATQFPIADFTLTDNNAAALSCAKLNMNQFEVKSQVLASDAGVELQQKFDLILCNPPFHQGFSVDTDLTEKFLLNTARLLQPKGKAFYVVNQFIPLEIKAEAQGFSRIETLIKKSGFKVVLLAKNA